MQAPVVARMWAGLVGAALMLACTAAAAQIAVNDWLGVYRMNHDGWRGQLAIADSKVDCLQPAWCRLRISYKDAEGRRHRAQVLRLTDSNQHLIFEIEFPNNPQRFDARLFSHDRRLMAGTTVWGGRTFGFFASREGASTTDTAKPGASTSPPRMLSDGRIEIDLGGGRKQRVSPAGEISLVDAQGHETKIMKAEVQVLAPPEPPPGSSGHKWLQAHADNLLDLIASLVPNDPNARSVYLQHEPAAPLYDKIKRRASVAQQLVSAAQ